MIIIKSGTDFVVSVAFKDDDHVPAVGLTPAITVLQISNGAAVVSAQTMTEMSLGAYKYTVPGASIALGDGYVVHVDGGATLTTYRYQYGSFYARLGDVWDEVLTDATHNVPASAGRRLRNIASSSIRQELAQEGGTNWIKLDAAASATDGEYDPAGIYIYDGLGAGQCRLILEYNGTTKVAYVDRNWKIIPDATSEFIIYSDWGRGSTNEGLLQAGGTTSVTLNPLADSTDETYTGQVIQFVSGAGDDQAAQIAAYNGTTKVATLDRTLASAVDATTCYAIMPFEIVCPAKVADAVLDELIAEHTVPGSLSDAIANIEGGTIDPTQIAGAVWNAERDDHVTLGTFGEAIDQKISLGGAGNGSTSRTILILDVMGNKVPGALVAAYYDIGMTQPATDTNSIYANSEGIATMYLRPGTYYLKTTALGSTFTNPREIVVPA